MGNSPSLFANKKPHTGILCEGVNRGATSIMEK